MTVEWFSIVQTQFPACSMCLAVDQANILTTTLRYLTIAMSCAASLLQQHLQRDILKPQSLESETCSAFWSCSCLLVLLQLAAVLWATLRAVPLPEVEKARNPHVDNAKFLAQVLVCWTHLSPLLIEGQWINIHRSDMNGFRMPLFVFLSGSFAHPYSRQILLKTVVGLGCPIVAYILVIFPLTSLLTSDPGTSLYSPPNLWLGHTPYWELSVPSLFFGSGPGFIIWFLRCLLLWRLASMFTCQWPKAQICLAVCGGCLATYLPEDPSGSGCVQGRFLALFPYFVMGQQVDVARIFQALPSLSRSTHLCFWLVLLSVNFLELDENNWRKLTFGVFEPFYLNHGNGDAVFPYDERCRWDFSLKWTRYLCQLFYRTAGIFIFLFLGVPRESTWFTHQGSKTLYSYLLHQIPLHVVRSLLAWLAVKHDYTTWSTWPWAVQYGAFMACATLLTLCLMLVVYATTSWPVRLVFGPLLEPQWLLNMLHVSRK